MSCHGRCAPGSMKRLSLNSTGVFWMEFLRRREFITLLGGAEAVAVHGARSNMKQG
jgi:hypothetical protein